ncbi:hypothetical protein CONPUDRAFT_162061 [Coniophora puteana RWD-64-598 SS2]|uniref:F-box domain-containing protein n=1 Tax=Coniophora puteana (strain RWD-64-598) TaxID=741705 RepID=A0A5M3N0C9_CONPW|nr:uncharacterized protein CONPUDRAFT_162061 [Coniophora puteana RWD-64-598 SS2]EIW84707.1 hypothetical protein CONPUDRAFT_162061 [Coniophora puteana RWD-64-598 SS2]
MSRVMNWLSSAERQLRTDGNSASSLEAVQDSMQRNTLVPIYRLPPELLVEIFAYLTPLFTVDQRNILNVSHVCPLWREVAVSCPTLWSAIKLRVGHHTRGSADLFRIMAERAEGLAVTFCLDSSSFTVNHSDLIREMCRHAGRMRQLDMQFNHLSVEQFQKTFDCFLSEFPALEEFSLHVTTDETIFLPTDFLVNAAMLRRLRLQKCAPPWGSAIFKRLTQLELHDLYDISPTVEDLWSLIRSTSSLEVLILDDALSQLTPLPPFWNDIDSSQVIYLPNLHHIEMNSTEVDAYFFSRIRVAKHAHIHLVVYPEAQPFGLPILPPAFFSASRMDTASRDMVTLKSGINIKFDVQRTLSERPRLQDCSRVRCTECENRFSAEFIGVGMLSTVAIRLLNSLYGGSPFLSVHALNISIDVAHRREYVSWRELLPLLPQLRILCATAIHPDLQNLLVVLKPPTQPRTQGILVPRLEKLVLSRAESYYPTPSITGLADTLVQRSQLGLSLRELVVTKVRVHESEMVRLKGVVKITNFA